MAMAAAASTASIGSTLPRPGLRRRKHQASPIVAFFSSSFSCSSSSSKAAALILDRRARIWSPGMGGGRDRVAAFAGAAVSESSDAIRPKRPGERKGFVEEMRFVAMKLHTKDQSKEGEKEADVEPVGSWKPSIRGYVQFLVDNKLVYETLEAVIETESHPSYAEFRETGLERSEPLAKDLEWFKDQGHDIPEPSSDGKAYAELLQTLAEEDPPAFICHFYNYYFAHTAGGRFIGKKVADEILDGRELEFYKWNGELPKLLNAVRDKINRIAQDWSREDKDRCLKETAKSFKFSGKILRKIISS